MRDNLKQAQTPLSKEYNQVESLQNRVEALKIQLQERDQELLRLYRRIYSYDMPACNVEER